jgi:hypothetical protein
MQVVVAVLRSAWRIFNAAWEAAAWTGMMLLRLATFGRLPWPKNLREKELDDLSQQSASSRVLFGRILLDLLHFELGWHVLGWLVVIVGIALLLLWVYSVGPIPPIHEWRGAK